MRLATSGSSVMLSKSTSATVCSVPFTVIANPPFVTASQPERFVPFAPQSSVAWVDARLSHFEKFSPVTCTAVSPSICTLNEPSVTAASRAAVVPNAPQVR
jgi:hypothetical protein